MDWSSALVGSVFGLICTLLAIRVQREWKKKDDETYSKKVIRSLIAEIEEAITRAKFMIKLHDKNGGSFSRLYIGLWESTFQRLSEIISNIETLSLLHRIYYRFDLINFNCEMNRPSSAGDFAKTHIAEVEENLAKLRELEGISETRKDKGLGTDAGKTNERE